MALNFPDNPSLNDTYRDSTSGFTYTWNGTVWISTVDRKIGNIKQVDDISASFDGSEAVFDFLCNGEVIAPLETNKTIVSLGGVLQNPGDDYSVFGTQITFSTPPTNGLTFFAQVLQTDQSKSTLPNASVGPEALSTGGFSWNSSGDFIVSGILTSGTSSVTLDGDANQITVGTAGTINESGIDIVGIITAGSYVGDGSNLDGIVGGLGTDGSANTSGIITATSFTGDGRNLTDVGGYLAGLIYNPGIGATQAATDTGIGITFTKSITKNTGVINLRENSISGTIVESFDVATVGSSSTIAISGATLSITPDSTLGTGTTYFVEVPANTVRDSYDTGGNLGITSFTFVTASTVPYSDPFDGTFQLYTTGSGSSGVLGHNNSGINYSSPRQISGDSWRYAVNQRNSAIATKTDGSLWSWGDGSGYVLGHNNLTPFSSPKQIPGTQWNDIAMTAQTSKAAMATKTDGTLWTWGTNGHGQLGHNNINDNGSPVQVQGTQWKVAFGEANEGTSSAFAFKTDGSLWGWGSNSGGSLGQNNEVTCSSPVQIPGTWETENGRFYFSRGVFAIKEDNSLWAWGYNGNGNLGFNDTAQRSSPKQVPGEWNMVTSGQANFGIKTDGTLWCIGGNGSNGSIPLNIADVPRSSPIQIPGTQWETVQGGNYFYVATKTDGSLWMWGYSAPGRFGNNNGLTTSYSSPIQVPGTQWAYGVVAEGSTFLMKNYS